MTQKTLKFEMTTLTRDGQVFSHGFYKTAKTMRRAKEKYNLKYGAHLGSRVIEHLADGTTRPSFCLA